MNEKFIIAGISLILFAHAVMLIQAFLMIKKMRKDLDLLNTVVRGMLRPEDKRHD